MKFAYPIAALVVAQMLANSTSTVAQERLLTQVEKKAYDACLYEAWIDDYCRFHSFGIFVSFDRAYRACVLANGVRKFPIENHPFVSAENYCWSAAQGERR